MYKSIDWGNAKWIGSPEITLDASRRSVFGIEAAFSGPGGIVFGADDARLTTPRRNIQNQAGRSYISYKLEQNKLTITRVGYAEDDSADIPFAEVEIPDMDTSSVNTLRIEVGGNLALTYLNGKLADGEEAAPRFPGMSTTLTGRQLNPLGHNDVITFPRLNKIGLLEGATYNNLRIFELREPKAELYRVEGDDCKKLVGNLIDPSHGGVTILRRQFDLSKEVKTAKLYATARGIYIGEVNGLPLNVSDTKDYFTPGASQFDKHLFYHSYSAPVKRGKNIMQFTLGSGWWSDAQSFALRNYNFWGNNPSLLVKLEVEYTDGTSETIVSNPEEWQASNDGPIRYASFFHGETYDARVEPSNWVTPVIVEPMEITATTFPRHPDLNFTQPKIIEHIGNTVGEVTTLKAQSVKKVEDAFIYDMGQNMVGIPRINVKGTPGQEITLRFGEVLYPNLPQYGYLQGMLMTENLRDADCTDIYICSGNPDGEVILPNLTFHGYRFIEISGITSPLPLEDVEGIVLSSILEETGAFECSDSMVNKLFENIKWSQRANFLSIPTDCPQRNERMGWMGDAQVFAATSVYNADVLEFFERFMISVRDLQREDGKFPNVAPYDVGFGGILWESAGIIIPWELYLQYGEKRVLEDNFEAMLKYVGYMRANTVNGLFTQSFGLGDWLATDMSTDNELVWNAVYAYDLRIVADSAKFLGKTEIFEELDALFHEVKSLWNKTFVDPTTGKTRKADGAINDTQTSYALPLYYGIFENSQKAAELLNEKTIALDYTLTTGFIGTPCISAALSDHGYADTAYKLLRQTKYPSWLYPITQGATSIWERWNSVTADEGFGGNNNMNSFNHYSLGAVGAWLYSRVLGIRPGENGGYKDFVLKPCFGGLDWVKGHYDTKYGRIYSEWNKEAEGYKWIVEIPEGTKAKAELPDGKVIELEPGKHIVN